MSGFHWIICLVSGAVSLCLANVSGNESDSSHLPADEAQHRIRRGSCHGRHASTSTGLRHPSRRWHAGSQGTCSTEPPPRNRLLTVNTAHRRFQKQDRVINHERQTQCRKRRLGITLNQDLPSQRSRDAGKHRLDRPPHPVKLLHLMTSSQRTDEHGRRRAVCNGSLPKREILTGAGKLAVSQPRARDRSPDADDRVRFTPSVLQPYLKRTDSIEEMIPCPCLMGGGRRATSPRY